MDSKAWAQEVAKKIKEKELAVAKRNVGKVPYTAENGVFNDCSGKDQWFLGRHDVAVISGNKGASL